MTTLAQGGAIAAFVMPFEELGRADVEVAGGKGANLGEMTRAGLPVPPGFVVTAEAFLASMDLGGVRAELREIAARGATRAESPEALAEAMARLQSLVQGRSRPGGARRRRRRHR